MATLTIVEGDLLSRRKITLWIDWWSLFVHAACEELFTHSFTALQQGSERRQPVRYILDGAGTQGIRSAYWRYCYLYTVHCPSSARSIGSGELAN